MAMAEWVIEPDYSKYKFQSKFGRRNAFASASSDSAFTTRFTEEDVQSIISSPIIVFPNSYGHRSSFNAPLPQRASLPERPLDPIQSGRFGRPTQIEFPSPPSFEFNPLSLGFGFRNSAIERLINQRRIRRAKREFEKRHALWERRCEEIKNQNRKALLEFQQRVRADPAYQAEVAKEIHWRQVAKLAEMAFQSAMQKWNAQREEFEKAQERDERYFAQLRNALEAGVSDALEKGVATAVTNARLWWPTRDSNRVHFDRERKILLVEFEFPDVEKFSFYKRNAQNHALKPVAKTQRRTLQEKLVYGLALRLAFDLATISSLHDVEQIALNGFATFTDKSTGRERTEVIVSLLVKPEEVLGLVLNQLDPKSAFRKLKGVMTADLSEYSPVVPIMVLDKNDSRIVASRDIMEGLHENENIAAMDWLDFEHLVRELFEKEFANKGMEVRITRASRDSGVDALAFDPDPLRGGKIVIQAKRYTRTVDVSAVRDLYGTLLNEGANRGILVTTSKFGNDSREFAQGKPITLIDGPQLLGLLLRHGYKFSIDLEAARRAGIRDA